MARVGRIYFTCRLYFDTTELRSRLNLICVPFREQTLFPRPFEILLLSSSSGRVASFSRNALDSSRMPREFPCLPRVQGCIELIFLRIHANLFLIEWKKMAFYLGTCIGRIVLTNIYDERGFTTVESLIVVIILLDANVLCFRIF